MRNNLGCDSRNLREAPPTSLHEAFRVGLRANADAKEVERGLKSEPRIGPGGYLSPGGPFAGGTLARDLVALTKIAEEKGEPIILIPAVCEPMIQS